MTYSLPHAQTDRHARIRRRPHSPRARAYRSHCIAHAYAQQHQLTLTHTQPSSDHRIHPGKLSIRRRHTAYRAPSIRAADANHRARARTRIVIKSGRRRRHHIPVHRKLSCISQHIASACISARTYIAHGAYGDRRTSAYRHKRADATHAHNKSQRPVIHSVSALSRARALRVRRRTRYRVKTRQRMRILMRADVDVRIASDHLTNSNCMHTYKPQARSAYQTVHNCAPTHA